ncbi:MAG: PilN domain-containing protein [Candidatus Eisenbacteria bacterium]|nr:PilN domain-containing protein [Candidatus Eisenbacteria bacterium]
MIRINLVPEEDRDRGALGERPRAISVFSKSFLTVSLFIVFAGTFFQIEQGRRVSEALSELEKNIELRKKTSSEILTRERELLKLKEYFAGIQSLTGQRGVPVLVLEELSRKLPGDLWYTSVFQSGSREITIEGVSFSNLRVAQLMGGIDRSTIFEGTKLLYSEKGTVSGRDVVKFKLTAVVSFGGVSEPAPRRKG